MNLCGPVGWLALAALVVPTIVAAQSEDDSDEAGRSFLGGSDPPCFLPCACLVWLVVFAAAAVAAAVALVLAGFALAAGVVLFAGGAVVATYLVLHGVGLLAALALAPGVVAVALAMALQRRTRSPCSPG